MEFVQCVGAKDMIIELGTALNIKEKHVLCRPSCPAWSDTVILRPTEQNSTIGSFGANSFLKSPRKIAAR